MKTRNLLSLLLMVALFSLFACKKDKEEPKIASIYFMDTTDELMKKLTLDGTGTITTVLDLAGKAGVGIAYDATHDMIYFSDFNDADTPDGKIWRMKKDGTGLTAIVSGLLDPYGIALDVAGGKVYWADDAGHISRANLDGTGKEDVVTLVDGWMRAVALDVENNKMYYYEVNNENLYVAALNGSNPAVLISGVYGYSIFIDKVNDKIYFDDQNTPALRRANMDGTGIVDIDNLDTRIYGIAMDEDNSKLYWSSRDTGDIFEANLNGTGKETVATGLSSPRGIFLDN